MVPKFLFRGFLLPALALSTPATAATTQEAYLKAGTTAGSDFFGYSVAISGDTAVVAADGENSTATDSGAVYVFVRSGSTWTQQAQLKASNAGAMDFFGTSVAISGDTIVVGVPFEDSNATGVNHPTGQSDESASNAGAAYIFVRNGTTWNQQAYLKASNTEMQDRFGTAVAVAGDTVVVSAPVEDSNATGVNGNQTDNNVSGAGAVYVFTRDGTTWSQQAYLKASNVGANFEQFGTSVAVEGNTVVVGALGDDSNATGINGDQSDNSAADAGAAYVFVRNGTTWSQQAYLKASNTGMQDKFGRAVALSGETVAIGAYDEASNATGVNGDQTDNNAGGAGAVYIFVRSGTTWTQQAYLKASNTAGSDNFGWAIALAGETLVAGAYKEDSNAIGINGNQSDNNASASGAAYVFVRSGTTWAQQDYLKASNSAADDNFGWAVAVSGNTVLVGSDFEDSNATGVNGDQSDNNASGAGAAYVFTTTASAGPEIAVAQPANENIADGGSQDFGSVLAGGSAALTFTIKNTGSADLTGLGITIDGPDAPLFTVTSGPTAPVSGPSGSTTFTVRFAPISAGTKTAVLHIASNDADETPFEINLTGSAVSVQDVTERFYVKASNTGAGDTFGYSVAMSGNTLVVGAPAEDSNATGVNGNQNNEEAGQSGAVYVFVRGVTTWTQQAYLKASDTGTGDQFGYSVAVSGDTIVVGAMSQNFEGAGYVFVRTGTTWAQQALLKASNAGEGDGFGAAVTLSGDTIVVGAATEDSSASGVNGDPTNNDLPGSGAAYVFVRTGTTWAQQAYLKASNPRQAAEFGSSLAVSGETVVVGALGESSNATGVNGNQNDTSAAGSGAAYVFVRSGATWSQQAYLKASNSETGDRFGFSVTVAGDTVVVGALFEDGGTGAAYPFIRNGATWTQQPLLKAGNGTPDGRFGVSVAAADDTLVVGAAGEANFAGAAYVLARNGSNWNQKAHLKAGNPKPEDRFGFAVAVSGSTVAVGAYKDHSNATGIDGDGGNGAALEAGAVYVFAPRPPIINDSGLTVLGNGAFQFSFLNPNNLPSTVLGTDDLSQPVANWTVLGNPTSVGGGVYQFTDPAAAGFSKRFYRLRFP